MRFFLLFPLLTSLPIELKQLIDALYMIMTPKRSSLRSFTIAPITTTTSSKTISLIIALPTSPILSTSATISASRRTRRPSSASNTRTVRFIPCTYIEYIAIEKSMSTIHVIVVKSWKKGTKREMTRIAKTKELMSATSRDIKIAITNTSVNITPCRALFSR